MLRIIATIGTIQIAAILINLIRAKIVAVTLGPTGVGVLSLIDQVVQFTAYVSAFSLPFASVKFLSRAHSEGTERFRQVYHALLQALLTLSVAGTALAALIAAVRPAVFSESLGPARGVVIVALLSIPASILAGFFTNVLASAQRPNSSALFAVIANSGLTLSSATGLLLAGIFGLYCANAIASTIIVAGAAMYCHRAFDLRRRKGSNGVLAEIRANPDVVFFSMMLLAASATSSWSLLVARSTLISASGQYTAGLLQSAISLALSLGLILSPTNGLYLTPLMNRNIATAHKIRTALQYQRNLMIIIGLASMVLILFPRIVLTVLFSGKFTEAGRYVWLFVVWQCLLQLAGVYQAILIGLDDLSAYTMLTCAGHIVQGVLSWILIPHLGVAGIAIALICGSGLIFAGTLLRLLVHYKFTMPVRVNAIMVYAVAAVAAAGAIFRDLDEFDPPKLMLRLLVLTVFSASLFAFLNRGERQRLRALCGTTWARVAGGAA